MQQHRHVQLLLRCFPLKSTSPLHAAGQLPAAAGVYSNAVGARAGEALAAAAAASIRTAAAGVRTAATANYTSTLVADTSTATAGSSSAQAAVSLCSAAAAAVTTAIKRAAGFPIAKRPTAAAAEWVHLLSCSSTLCSCSRTCCWHRTVDSSSSSTQLSAAAVGNSSSSSSTVFRSYAHSSSSRTDWKQSNCSNSSRGFYSSSSNSRGFHSSSSNSRGFHSSNNNSRGFQSSSSSSRSEEKARDSDTSNTKGSRGSSSSSDSRGQRWWDSSSNTKGSSSTRKQQQHVCTVYTRAAAAAAAVLVATNCIIPIPDATADFPCGEEDSSSKSSAPAATTSHSNSSIRRKIPPPPPPRSSSSSNSCLSRSNRASRRCIYEGSCSCCCCVEWMKKTIGSAFRPSCMSLEDSGGASMPFAAAAALLPSSFSSPLFSTSRVLHAFAAGNLFAACGKPVACAAAAAGAAAATASGAAPVRLSSSPDAAAAATATASSRVSGVAAAGDSAAAKSAAAPAPSISSSSSSAATAAKETATAAAQTPTATAQAEAGDEPAVGKNREELPTYSEADLRKHGSSSSSPSGRLWVSYREGIYDITDFLDAHPGGRERLLLAAGKDLEPFWRVYGQHASPAVHAFLETMRVGNLQRDAAEAAAAAEEAAAAGDFAAAAYRRELLQQRHPALVVRSTAPFNAETPAALLVDAFLTPQELFFVRNHMPLPEVPEEGDYVLLVEVEVPDEEGEEEKVKQIPVRSFTLHQLQQQFQLHHICCTLQCAGNRRSTFSEKLPHKPVRGLDWGPGAIGTAIWTGCLLADVLRSCGFDEVTSRALGITHVHFEGRDKDPLTGVHYGASIPISRALAGRSLPPAVAAALSERKQKKQQQQQLGSLPEVNITGSNSSRSIPTSTSETKSSTFNSKSNNSNSNNSDSSNSNKSNKSNSSNSNNNSSDSNSSDSSSSFSEGTEGMKRKDHRIGALSISASTTSYGSRDVLLAFEMNGEPLTADHGYPLRVVVPGSVGARSVKWLRKIILSFRESPSPWQQHDYKLTGPSEKLSTREEWSSKPSIVELPVQSAICLPSAGTVLPPGIQSLEMRGYAWSGGGSPIVRVDVSVDEGQSWHQAALQRDPAAAAEDVEAATAAAEQGPSEAAAAAVVAVQRGATPAAPAKERGGSAESTARLLSQKESSSSSSSKDYSRTGEEHGAAAAADGEGDVLGSTELQGLLAHAAKKQKSAAAAEVDLDKTWYWVLWRAELPLDDAWLAAEYVRQQQQKQKKQQQQQRDHQQQQQQQREQQQQQQLQKQHQEKEKKKQQEKKQQETFEFEQPEGSVVLHAVCRAVDANGNTQPDTCDALWNERGCLNNAWHSVRLFAWPSPPAIAAAAAADCWEFSAGAAGSLLARSTPSSHAHSSPAMPSSNTVPSPAATPAVARSLTAAAAGGLAAAGGAAAAAS